MTVAAVRLWRGEVPLPSAFWNWAVAGGLVVNVVTTTLFFVFLTMDLPILALVGGYALSVPYNVLVIVGVWRAAGRYQGDRAWADAARIVTTVGLGLLTFT